jgi:hypothetical protein
MQDTCVNILDRKPFVKDSSSLQDRKSFFNSIGHFRPDEASSMSSHVRYAPKATKLLHYGNRR